LAQRAQRFTDPEGDMGVTQGEAIPAFLPVRDLLEEQFAGSQRLQLRWLDVELPATLGWQPP
jgi:hypothetical protein